MERPSTTQSPSSSFLTFPPPELSNVLVTSTSIERRRSFSEPRRKPSSQWPLSTSSSGSMTVVPV
jgi:hypothetical protein